jgi:pimeloyl-ACP methyl ester carboxylesterase
MKLKKVIVFKMTALVFMMTVSVFSGCIRNEAGRSVMKNRLSAGRTRVASRSFNEMAIGSGTERIDGFDPRKEQENKHNRGTSAEERSDEGSPPDASLLYDFAGSLIEDLVIKTGTAILRGFLYRPDNAASAETQTAVLFFSGTAGSNASMAGSVAARYNSLGALVIGVDYRGFGESNNREGLEQLTGATITEASLYEDGMAIYNYATVVLGIAPENIILHGFSLGGAVAAWVAAQTTASGSGDGCLGGLVLHSSIRDMTHAAALTLPLVKPLAYGAGWLGGLLTGGAYNTRAHLEILAWLYPGIPIHFRGGRRKTGDDLGLDATGLERIPGFTDKTVYVGDEGHQSAELESKTAANMSGGLEFLERLIRGKF